MEDDEFDVWWLAAEGLIHIGAEAIEPLLKALTERPDSIWLREGVYYILHDLRETNFKESVKSVLGALEDVQPSLEVTSAAEEALDVIARNTRSWTSHVRSPQLSQLGPKQRLLQWNDA